MLVLLVANVVGQFFTWYQRPSFYDLYYDSENYLQVANRILAHGQWVDPLRTPAYPGFLVAFLALPMDDPLRLAMIVQTILVVAATFEVYLLVYRLTALRWLAALAGVLLATNLYVTQWQRTINSEALAYWLLITLFLVFERYLRRPRVSHLAWIALLSLALIFARPFFVYVPFVLLGLALLRAARLHQLRAQWKSVTLSLALISAVLVGYMQLNRVTNGYFGLSDAVNINLLGKVMNYGMIDATNNPRYNQLRADLHYYPKACPQPPDFRDPWPFVFYCKPEYQAQGMAFVGAYSRELILQHPGWYVRDSLPEVVRSWTPAPRIYGHRFTNTPADGLRALSGQTLQLYWLLPLAFVASALWVALRPRSGAALVMLALAICMIGDILLTAFLSYDPNEFYRLRSPVDWGIVVLCAVLGAQLLRYVWGAIARARGRQATRRQSAAVAESGERLMAQGMVQGE